MQDFYEVANWDQYQHYSKRNPPWIKLHFALLSGETWVTLDDASRVLAVACMLLASRNDGKVPANPAYVQRVAYLNQLPNFKPLVDSGFLIDASNLLADASTMHTNARPETETEQSQKTEKRQRGASKPALSGFDEFWAAYPRKTGKGAAEASWSKVPKSAHPAIMEAIQKQRNGADWQQDGGRFIPHPATWLNQRRWEDEVTVFSAPSPGHTIITPRPTAGPGSEPIKPLKEIAEDDLPAVPLRALVNQLRGGA